jgi:hypothetical protein
MWPMCGKISELLIHLVNAQIALADANNEISDLKRKLEKEDTLKILEQDMDYQIDGGFFTRKSEAGKG